VEAKEAVEQRCRPHRKRSVSFSATATRLIFLIFNIITMVLYRYSKSPVEAEEAVEYAAASVVEELSI